MSKPKRLYDDEFRKKALEQYFSGKESITASAKKIGISPSTLRTWIKRHQINISQKQSSPLPKQESGKELIDGNKYHYPYYQAGKYPVNSLSPDKESGLYVDYGRYYKIDEHGNYYQTDNAGNYCKTDKQQYDLLKKCSDAKDLTEWNEWRENNRNTTIYLQGADFSNWYLQSADLSSAECQGAIFRKAKCQKADFTNTECQGANFNFAECQEVYFWDAECQGAIFRFAKCQKAEFGDANCQGADFSYAKCQGAYFGEAQCQGAIFRYAKCQEANFRKAECQGADFRFAECQEANFRKAECQGADLRFAKCQGAIFFAADCPGANFSATILDSSTNLVNIKIDDITDFSYSNLASPLIEPSIKTKLEHNIRKKSWCQWYEYPVNSNKTRLKKCLRFLYTFPIRFFWFISDYGYSTTRILICFAFFTVFYSGIYFFFPDILRRPEQVTNAQIIDTLSKQINALTPLPQPSIFTYNKDKFFINKLSKQIPQVQQTANNREHLSSQNNQAPLALKHRIAESITFSLSTMVTLGFGGINCNPANIPGMLVVTLNLLTGYFLLAVLVTRLSVLFTSLAPSYTPPPPPSPKKE